MPSFTLLTMTTGMSLEAWKKTGLFSREMGYYLALSQHIGPIRILSYGNPSVEQDLVQPFSPNIDVICARQILKGSRYSDLLSSIVAPLNTRHLKGCKLVRSNQFNGSWTGLMLAKRLGVPFVLRCGYLYSTHYRQEYPNKLWQNSIVKTIESFIVQQSDAIIVTYSGAKDYFVAQYDISCEKIHVLGNPIDTNLFKPTLLSNGNRRGVISVAKHTDQKNLPALIQACESQQIPLTLVGDGSDTDDLKKLVHQTNAKVSFLGRIPNENLPEILAGHDVFVLPSFYEGNPKALLEAMSMGMPVVASDIEEHRGIITDGRDGVLCGTDSTSIAKALESVLNNNTLKKQIGDAARDRIMSDYSCVSNAYREAEIHQEILKKA